MNHFNPTTSAVLKMEAPLKKNLISIEKPRKNTMCKAMMLILLLLIIIGIACQTYMAKKHAVSSKRGNFSKLFTRGSIAAAPRYSRDYSGLTQPNLAKNTEAKSDSAEQTYSALPCTSTKNQGNGCLDTNTDIRINNKDKLVMMRKKRQQHHPIRTSMKMDNSAYQTNDELIYMASGVTNRQRNRERMTTNGEEMRDRIAKKKIEQKEFFSQPSHVLLTPPDKNQPLATKTQKAQHHPLRTSMKIRSDDSLINRLQNRDGITTDEKEKRDHIAKSKIEEKQFVNQPNFVLLNLPDKKRQLATKTQLKYNRIKENVIYPMGKGKALNFYCKKNSPCYRIDQKTGRKIYYVCFRGNYCHEADLQGKYSHSTNEYIAVNNTKPQ